MRYTQSNKQFKRKLPLVLQLLEIAAELADVVEVRFDHVPSAQHAHVQLFAPIVPLDHLADGAAMSAGDEHHLNVATLRNHRLQVFLLQGCNQFK